MTASLGALTALATASACARSQAPGAPVARPAPTAPAGTAARGAGSTAGSDDPFATFAPVGRPDWPGPNRYRTAAGAPGPEYWQQRADYQIAATLDTARGGTVSGQVTIRYTNNSPDTLRFVWLQLDQNLYRPGSKGSAMFPADSRWGVRGFEGGFELADVTVDGRAVPPRVDDTMMRLDLAQPIAPRGGRATIAMRFSFRVPEHGSDRMGRDGTLFEIAQWYPRMAVYDDVRGWNTDPYLGQGEFYLEYGDIDYSVTAPAATWSPAAARCRTPSRCSRPRSASGWRAPGASRGARGQQRGRGRRGHARGGAGGGALAGRRHAHLALPRRAGARRGVGRRPRLPLGRDQLEWDPLPGLLPVAARQPRLGERGGADLLEHAHLLGLFFPYPYPQATSVAGPVGGMEYPMLVMVHYGTDDPASIFGTLDHEQGHEWFPMLVGSNERRYAWQDEGFNTYINAFSSERRYPGTSAFAEYRQNWAQVREGGIDAPLMTRPDHLDARALGGLAYRKPAAVLLTLRNHVLGPDAFDRAFREYARRWAFRHPTPADFFRTVENVSGMDLAWYWRSFFYTSDVLDIAVEGVTNRTAGGETIATLALRRTTSVPFPVQARLKLADGTTRDVRFPVDLWARPHVGARVEASVAVAANVVGVRLWPDGTVPDWDASNDTWGDAPAAGATAQVTGGGLSGAVGGR
jgi:hypothetical protein